MKTHLEYVEELENHYADNSPSFDRRRQPRYWYLDAQTGCEKVCAIGLIMESPKAFAVKFDKNQ